ncbi:MAG: hypothetical protein IK954_03340 [Clostridia bacterium]|nr:hypothetical protein [Clostridia bacterium]
MSKRTLIGQSVVTAVLAVYPLFFIVGGIRRLSEGYLPEWPLLLMHFILPPLLYGLAVWLIWTRWHPMIKLLLGIAWLGLVWLVTVFSFLLLPAVRWEQTTGETAWKHYESIPCDALSARAEMGEPLTVDHYRYVCEEAIFVTESDILFCRYDEEQYDEQCRRLSALPYYTEPFSVETESEHISVSPEVSVNGYRFRVVEDESLYFPKRMLLVGTNDSTGVILYIYTCDLDLDYIKSLEDHIGTSGFSRLPSR